MSESYKLGLDGEKMAVDYLTRNKYQILDQRWHLSHLEIDIVALDQTTGELVFCEVKTRGNTIYGAPEEAVDYKKIMRSVHAADAYIKQEGRNEPWRFDIIAIISANGGKHIQHFKEAFYPPLG